MEYWCRPVSNEQCCSAVLYTVLCTAGARGKVEFAVLLSSNLHDWCLYSYSVRAKNNIFLSRKILKEARKKRKTFTQDTYNRYLPRYNRYLLPRYNRFINQYVPQELSFFIILISPTRQMTMTPKLS